MLTLPILVILEYGRLCGVAIDTLVYCDIGLIDQDTISWHQISLLNIDDVTDHEVHDTDLSHSPSVAPVHIHFSLVDLVSNLALLSLLDPFGNGHDEVCKEDGTIYRKRFGVAFGIGPVVPNVEEQVQGCYDDQPCHIIIFKLVTHKFIDASWSRQNDPIFSKHFLPPPNIIFVSIDTCSRRIEKLNDSIIVAAIFEYTQRPSTFSRVLGMLKVRCSEEKVEVIWGHSKDILHRLLLGTLILIQNGCLLEGLFCVDV
jgi:hypothetical protein